MKAIVTGSNGFIGKHLISYLDKSNIRVFPISHQSFRIISVLKEEIKEIKPDFILHLASYGNHSFQQNYKKMFSANIENTLKLIMVTNDIPYKAFINFGSSSEYGKKNHPMKETDLLETDTFYGVTKASATLVCRAFANQYNKPIVTVRPFSVYGEGEADFRFIPKVVQHLNSGETMTVDPKPKHDWIYIQDFIFGVYNVLKNINNWQGETVNIGTGIQYSNLEVIRVLEKISRKKLRIKMLPNIRNYDSTNWVADNQRLRSIGWEQRYSLEEGLKKTYEYYTK